MGIFHLKKKKTKRKHHASRAPNSFTCNTAPSFTSSSSLMNFSFDPFSLINNGVEQNMKRPEYHYRAIAQGLSAFDI